MTWGWLACVAIAAGCGFTAPANGLPDDGGVDDAPLPPAVVNFAAAMSTEDEMSGGIQILVTLSRPATSTITVPYRIVPNSGAEWATPGVDFDGADGTITFNPGDEIKGIDLTIISDSADEDNEKIQLELQTPTGDATLGSVTSHTVTISAFFLPRVGFMTATATGGEGTANVQLTLTLTSAATADVTVGYTVTGDAETMSTPFPDHNLVAGSIVIPAGMTSIAIPVTVTDDAYDEDDEHLVVTLTSSLNAVVDSTRTSHDYTIVDNDNPPTVTFMSTTRTEDEAETDVTLVAQLSVRSEKAISVGFAQSMLAPANAATITDDFTYTTPGPLTWTAGATTLTRNIVVHIVDDELDEFDEIVETVFVNASNVTIPANTRHTLTIRNVDTPSVVSFDPTTPNLGNIAEGSNGNHHNHGLNVILSKPSGKPITVTFTANAPGNNAATYGDTITGGGNQADYTTMPTPTMGLSFAVGDTTKVLTVRIRADNGNEPNELGTLTLTATTNATLAADMADKVRTFTITNDDN